MNGSVNPLGASVNVSFEFGTTTAYGSTTTPQKPVRTTSATSSPVADRIAVRDGHPLPGRGDDRLRDVRRCRSDVHHELSRAGAEVQDPAPGPD